MRSVLVTGVTEFAGADRVMREATATRDTLESVRLGLTFETCPTCSAIRPRSNVTAHRRARIPIERTLDNMLPVLRDVQQ